MNQLRQNRSSIERMRQTRQILAGDAVRPTDDPWATADGSTVVTALQRNYLIILAVIVIVGGALLILGHTALATLPLFFAALLLIAGRVVF